MHISNHFTRMGFTLSAKCDKTIVLGAPLILSFSPHWGHPTEGHRVFYIPGSRAKVGSRSEEDPTVGRFAANLIYKRSEPDVVQFNEYRKKSSPSARCMDTSSRSRRSAAGISGPLSKVRVSDAVPPSSSGATVRKSSSTRWREIMAWLRPGPPSTRRDSIPRSALKARRALLRSTEPLESTGVLISRASLPSREATPGGLYLKAGSGPPAHPLLRGDLP